MVEQASNKTKNTSYSARQGVSQGQKPYTQTIFFALRKFPFPRSTVSRTVWLRSAVSPRYARSDNRSALSDNMSYFPPISESETFSRKKKLVFVSVLPQGHTLSSSRNNYSLLWGKLFPCFWGKITPCFFAISEHFFTKSENHSHFFCKFITEWNVCTYGIGSLTE